MLTTYINVNSIRRALLNRSTTLIWVDGTVVKYER